MNLLPASNVFSLGFTGPFFIIWFCTVLDRGGVVFEHYLYYSLALYVRIIWNLSIRQTSL